MAASAARNAKRGALMSKFTQRFLANETGATAIEYGLIVAFIAVVIVIAVSAVGTSLKTDFNSINSGL